MVDDERGADEVEVTIVTMAFDSSDPDRMAGVLAKYVVLTRGASGCRNVDLCLSTADDHRFVVISKWDSPRSQAAHFDSAEMVDMARACRGLLRRPPVIELLEGMSAHDLN